MSLAYNHNSLALEAPAHCHSHLHPHPYTSKSQCQIQTHRSISTSTKSQPMPLDTWLSRVTCRRCGVPEFRVPLMSYPFAYPPNCETTFQAINSNSPRKSSRLSALAALKLHHLMLPQITITSARPPDMSTASVQLDITCFVSQPASRKWPSFHASNARAQSIAMPKCPAHNGRATRGARHAGTTNLSFHRVQKSTPRSVRPNIPKGDPVVVAQKRNSAP